MDDQQRAYLVEQINELDEAMSELEKARKPFDKAISTLYGLRENLLERHQADIAGRCESCMEIIFNGDLWHVGEDMAFCKEHAPTWRDCKESWEDALKRGEVEEDEARENIASIEAKLAGGISLDDKNVWPA